MRLCCNCFEELLDREIVCPICNSSITLDNDQTKNFYCLVDEVRKANKLKIKLMKKDSKYEMVFKYIEYRDKHPKDYNYTTPKILKNNNYEYDEEYWNRINNHTINKDEIEQTITVECPYCHSKHTKKISTTSKVISTAIFGVFGTKRFKNYHCNNCNSDF